MISLTALWLPVLLSAVLVFVASSLIHTVLKWHNSDYRGFTNEDEVREAIRKGSPTPGMYVLPYCADHKGMGSEAMQKKYSEGPVGMAFLKASCPLNMAPFLVKWFLYTLGVSLFAAYLSSRTLAPSASYLQVFRVAGTIAFGTYAGGAFPAAIWMGQPWRAALKDVADGLIYALLTAGAFAWLWPH